MFFISVRACAFNYKIMKLVSIYMIIVSACSVSHKRDYLFTLYVPLLLL